MSPFRTRTTSILHWQKERTALQGRQRGAGHVWLGKVKYQVRVVFRWFELEARLCPMGGEALAMQNLEL